MDETTHPTRGTEILAFAQSNGSDQPLSQLVHLTPELAADWLEHNVKNRNIRDDYVTELAAAMLRGEWRLNGDAIRWSTDGVILDGQHRLWALVQASQTKSDISIETFVIFNLPPETQETMDGGRKRLLADILKMRGETNTMQLAATLNRLHLWRQGEAALRFAGHRRLTVKQAIALLESEPNIRMAVRVGSRIRAQLNNTLSVSMVSACLYRFDQIDHEDSLEFWRQVTTGEGLKRHDPSYELRQAIIKNAARRHKLPPLVMHALIIKAWNAFREGRKIQLLAWKMGGKAPEKFPEPV